MTSDLFGLDAYAPAEIARRVRDLGVRKARLSAPTTFGLAVLAGGFIGLGALGFLVITSDAALSFAVGRVLGGLLFCTGLILVILAGAELFTGNTLLVLAWTSRELSTAELFRHWGIVLLGNLVGAVGLALLTVWADVGALNEGAVGTQMVKLANLKAGLPLTVAFFRGLICNILVCLAVWIALAGHTVTDKILAILWPITLFVVAGLEHSVANFFFLALGYLQLDVLPELSMPPIQQCLLTLSAVLLGNLAGGGILVGLVYWWIYLRPGKAA